ncbi:MAG: hypothetical protein IPK10_04210 [Bacteroidetes bacterium]|nr:hypothetical protein [Bacteroidota bacterium]
MNSRKMTSAYGDNVHTLAQVGTKKTSTLPKGYVIVNGNGSDLNDLKTKKGEPKKSKLVKCLH